jgi:hypothetical protein
MPDNNPPEFSVSASYRALKFIVGWLLVVGGVANFDTLLGILK